MINLNEFLNNLLNESAGAVSDDAIWYWTGIHVLNAMDRTSPAQLEQIIKKYNITKNNPRPGVIKYMKDSNPPLPKDSEEFIHRSKWDLASLVGETEGQLLHKAYYDMANHVAKPSQKHKILTLMQCSAKKPYSHNRINKANYYDPYGEYTDFVCMSNPGIIPIESSKYYPYRYDEWNIPNEEKLHEIINMTQKYRIVNMCRFLKYVKDGGYKHVIIVMASKYKQWIFEELIKHNIEGAKDWLHIVTDDSLRTRIDDKVPAIRIPLMRECRHKFETILKKCVKDVESSQLSDLNKTIKDRHSIEAKNESIDDPQYKVKQSVDYTEFLNKFKKNIKYNMENGEVDKGKNNLFYKSYYWTALDLLLMALDGDLVYDIDKEYFNFVDKLTKDSDFEKLNEFVFCFKPLMKKDDVSMKTVETEAKELKIIKPKDTYHPTLDIF